MLDSSGGLPDVPTAPPLASKEPGAPIVLVGGADENYAMALGVTLYSALANLNRGTSADVYVLDGGMTEGSQERLRHVLDVDGVDVNLVWVRTSMDAIRDLRIDRWLSTATYLRLLIPEILPTHIEKAIYLDSDLLVRGDLMRLWRTDLGGHPILAVRSFHIPYVSSNEGVSKYTELGLSPDQPYFNAGVLVMNLRLWREEEISQKVYQYLRDYREYVNYHDQEGLNAVLAGNWGELDPAWNVSRRAYMLTEAKAARRFTSGRERDWVNHRLNARRRLIESPHVIHFTGQYKPWQFDCKHPAQEEWIGYLGESGWFSRAEWVRWRFPLLLRDKARSFRGILRRYIPLAMVCLFTMMGGCEAVHERGTNAPTPLDWRADWAVDQEFTIDVDVEGFEFPA